VCLLHLPSAAAASLNSNAAAAAAFHGNLHTMRHTYYAQTSNSYADVIIPWQRGDNIVAIDLVRV
jgi:hypothetical protein